MDGWATLWGVLFVTAMVIFAAVAVVVTIGGFSDIRAMLKRITEQHAEDTSDSE